MNKIVIYHAGCSDGFCAAWLFNTLFPDAEFFPAHYNEPPPDVKGKMVYILDFSYKRPVMEKIIEEANHVTVLDHHKTAEEELRGLENNPRNPDIVFDMSKSGARLAWEWLYDRYCSGMAISFQCSYCSYCQIKPHWLVQYTEDRDLWLNQLSHTKEINAYIRSLPFSFDEWSKIKFEHPNIFVKQGEAILKYQRTIIDTHKNNATLQNICGFMVPTVNATSLFSEIAGELSVGHPFAACYFDRADGLRQYSLRSSGDFDVSKIAKKMGGGGHKNAAGFEVRV